MKEEEQKTIQRLTFENFIWVAFIFISLLDIYGDELIKKSIREHDQKADLRAKKIFLYVMIVSIGFYIYFLLRNYSDVKTHPQEEIYQIRFLGSIFVLVGTLCLFYFQLKTSNPNTSPSNV